MKEEETNVAKCMPPLGPFPRYIWIHQATPPDSLDKVCYDIWRRTQSLPDGLKPKNASLLPEKPKEVKAEHSVEPVIDEKDDITRLVEQEYMNLIMENLFDCFPTNQPMSTNENNTIEKEALEKKAQALRTERLIKSLLFKKHSPGKILPTKAKKSWCENRFVGKNSTSKQDSCKTDYSKTEGHHLLVQNQVKTAEALRDIPTTTVTASNLKTSSIPVTLNSDIQKNENQHKENGRRLRVFAKLCEKVQVPKTQKPPPGLTTMCRVRYFPGMIRPRQPGLVFIPPPSSVVVGAMNYSYCLGFPHPVPSQTFLGQYQFNPVNPQQVAQCFCCLPFVPQVYNFQCVRPNISSKQRNAPKPSTSIKDLSPTVGNKPQDHHYAHRFNHSITRTKLNRTHDTSFANGMKPL